ncbi:MAG: hypothetical protein ACRDV3_03125 [Acidothermaceae bacterium]
MAANVSTFPLSTPINLVIRLSYGSITVNARDGLAEAVVRLTPREPSSDVVDQITAELQGTTLLVSGPHQRGLADLIGRRRPSRDSIDAVIEVPTDTALKISTATADVTVTGRCGGADIMAGVTGINLDTVAGDLRVRYGSGSTRLAEVTGQLECGFGTGELIVGVVRGDVRSRAGSGSAQVGAAHGDVDVALGSGPITIGLPAGVSARVSATSGSGQVRSDLPVEKAQAPGTHPVTVRARTGNGDVRLVRADVAA